MIVVAFPNIFSKMIIFQILMLHSVYTGTQPYIFISVSAHLLIYSFIQLSVLLSAIFVVVSCLSFFSCGFPLHWYLKFFAAIITTQTPFL